LELSGVAPLMCAGITLYSPLKHWKAGPGKKVGVSRRSPFSTTKPLL